MQNKKQTIQAIKRWLNAPSIVDISAAHNTAFTALKTPPMGWSSRKVFAQDLSQQNLIETVEALVDKGLVLAGYNNINIYDGWQSDCRDEHGNITADFNKFPSGIDTFISNSSALGVNVGLYLSCAVASPAKLVGSQNNEINDALTIAKLGVSRLNYNLSNLSFASVVAPIISGINVQLSSDNIYKKSSEDIIKLHEMCIEKYTNNIEDNCMESDWLNLSKGLGEGSAKIITNKGILGGYLVCNLSKASGRFSINYTAEVDGEYDINIVVKSAHGREKLLVVSATENEYKILTEPAHEKGISNYCLNAKLHLTKGENTLTFINPVRSKKDSKILYFNRMATALNKATQSCEAHKNLRIEYSIDDKGKSKPYLWAKGTCNTWRTTRDITCKWERIKRVYIRNSMLYSFASPDGWNDPDVLEVGNGKLTFTQNKSHFTLWCMMNAPLILSTDVRYISGNLLDVVTNTQMISINQDKLGKQAKVVRKGAIDMIAKPLSGGDVAVCIFNKTAVKGFYNFSLASLIKDAYVHLSKSSSYTAREVWSDREETVTKSLCGSIDKDDVHVFILSAK